MIIVGNFANFLSGAQGTPSTVYIKFDPARMVPAVYSTNPDALRQSSATQSQGTGIIPSSPSFSGVVQDDQGVGVGGNGIYDDFKLWLSRHPGLSIEEAFH